MLILSDLEEVDYQLRSSSEDFPRWKGSIQCCDFGTFQEGSNQNLGLAHEYLGNGRGEGLARQPNQGTEVTITTWLQPREAFQHSDPCKDWEAGGRQRTRQHLRQGYFGRGRELHSLIILSISPTQSGEKFFPGVGDGYVP